MHRFLFGIPIVLTVAAAAAAHAENTLLAGLDANGDGMVTRAEFDAARLRDFRLLDRNGNKVISRREFYWRGRPEDRELLALRKRRYRLMDVNDDGGITGAEYLAYGHKVFARMDRNRDRRLAAEEIAATRGVQVASRDVSPADTDSAPAKATPAKTNQPAPAKRDTAARALGDMPFAAVDADGDGYVSRAEFRRASLTLFRRLDRNGNKVLSRREYYWRGSIHDKTRLAARKAAYRRADGDDDGGLTAVEFLKMTRGLYARIDRRDKGRVSRAEWIAAFGAEPTTTTARRPEAPMAKDTRASKTPAKPMLMVRSLRKGTSVPVAVASRRKPAAAPKRMTQAKPTEVKPTEVKPAEVKPASVRKTAPTADTALLARMDKSKANKPAPQVASRPAPTETPKTDKPAIDPRLVFAFRSLDRDRDGKISGIELAFARLTRFAALDANHDQILQASEFVGKRGAAAMARFREMDRDGNGLVTWDEYKAAGTQRFKQLDTNRDQRLSLEEFANAGRVNNTKVHYVKRIKVKPTREAKRADTRARPMSPFEYETPSR